MTDRTLISVTGEDAEDFLQNLVTNDVTRTRGGGIVYTALLTPQGKLIADFFVVGQAEGLLIDAPAAVAPQLFQRLSMYKLRAKVALAESPLQVRRGTGTPPAGALPDPRDPAMGWRLYGEEGGDDGSDWDALRVAAMVPEWGRELGPESYILEYGFERLNGVDFRKGCYVGQEIAARMKHKTELRKGLARVRIEGIAEPGAAISAEGREAGTLHTVAGDSALAYLRYDRARGALAAGEAVLRLEDPAGA
ncbi:YgfZ/GcvT domain-containing protein [Pseudoroseicyclus aestuarii]|nr:folate-binding protein YgfZ [Pseudoroseicyclus aestuarii]